MINYFNFKKKNDRYLITNDLGKYMFISENTFSELLSGNVSDDNVEKDELIEKGFIIENNPEVFIKKSIPYIQSMKSYCLCSTALHIFAVTNKCNLDCIYCQAHTGSSKLVSSMTAETGKKAVDFALQSPNKYITFEFQGGEPLLNFDVIKEMIEHSKLVKGDKEIEYTIVTNLLNMTEDKLKYLTDNNVHICTSLDGPANVHNNNRPCVNGNRSYEIVISKINELRQKGVNVSAIQTTSNYSLNYPEEIVNQYLDIGINNIFLRSLTPLGMADSDWDKIGYTADEFLVFYRKAFNYIMDLNKKGIHFTELHACYFLKKILCNYADNYMELRSPCGAGVGQMSYYHDGSVYTCDEGRMLAEMGDNSFLLGNVNSNTYNEAICSPICAAVCKSSVVESLPKCSGCVYQPYCGICPIINYASTNSLYGTNVKDFRCTVYKGIMDIIFDILQNGTEEEVCILQSWMN